MLAIFYTTLLYFRRKYMLWALVDIVLVTMLFALVMGSLALTETNKVVIDFFLMMVETVALFFVLFFGSHVLADERQQKTMYLLLSKKYDTAYILLGKFMAYFVLVVVIYLSFLWWFLLMWVDVTVSVLLVALLASCIKVLIVLSMTLFFVTFMSPYIIIVVMLALYFLSHATQFLYWYSLEVDMNAFMQSITTFVFYIFPPFDSLSLKEYVFFWKFPLTTAEIVSIFGMSWVYICVFLFFWCAILHRQRIKKI